MERFGQDLLLLEKLAAGGMAEVHRAKQLGYGGFEKTVAVKRILPHYAASEEFKTMFRMEANLSGLLQHPNIVQVFTNGDFEGYLYLVMEFVDGRNLRQLLARADKAKVKIPIEIACHMIAEAAKGLEYAHHFLDEKTGQPLEIVHRDMSPQNIMLSYDGGVKIVDFGIAKAAARADMTRAGVLKGKFGYMSPEQAQGQKLDKRTDIFALGIILFEVLTQRRLFTTDDDLRTLQLVRECRVPRPSRYNPAIPPTLDRIVMKALAKEKGERYATAGDLYGDLLRFMNQTFPKFIPTDFSKFMKSIFADDIVEERKKREKMAAEAPARVAAPVGRSSETEGKNAAPAKPASNKKRAPGDEDTAFDEEIKTEISQLTGDNAFVAGPNEVEAQTPASSESAPPEKDKEGSLPSIVVGASSTDVGAASPAQSAAAPSGDHTSVDASPKAAPKQAEADFDETRMTNEGTAPDILPPPGESVFAPTNLSDFSLSIPSNMSTATKGGGNSVPLTTGGGKPLTLALQDVPPLASGGNTYSRVEPMVRPLGMSQRRSSKRPLLYGVALLFLGALIYFQNQEQEGGKMVADSSPGPSVKKEDTPTPAPGVSIAQNSDAVTGGASAVVPEDANRNVASEAPGQVAPPAPPTQQQQVQTPVQATPTPAPPQQSPVVVSGFPTDDGRADITSVPKGYLNINSRPRATEIYINGELQRKPAGGQLETPLQRFPVPAGRYKLRLANPVFKVQWEEEIEVQADKILPLNPTLK